MSDAKALEEIKQLAARNSIVYTSHARKRMQQRGADRNDVKNALISATSATWQDDHDTWRVAGGSDLDGDDLTVYVDIQADVVVVTIT